MESGLDGGFPFASCFVQSQLRQPVLQKIFLIARTRLLEGRSSFSAV